MRRHSRKASVKVGLLVVAVMFAIVTTQAQWKTPWSYEGARGPDHWGDLDPDYATCKNGTQQSPIDIRDAQKADLPALRFEYKSGPLRIINNGYTAVRVNYPPGNGNVLIVENVRYELTQFHFHHPSEEQVNGKTYDMVIHFMHRSSGGKVAGVAVLVRAGSANTTVQQLWTYMPDTEGPEKEISGIEVNPMGLLPRNLGYYTYTGSQTAPPCTEPVTWFVLKNPIDISSEQINAFAKLYPHDVRPIQPLNGRVVREMQ
jgi:carbonic anhydrase